VIKLSVLQLYIQVIIIVGLVQTCPARLTCACLMRERLMIWPFEHDVPAATSRQTVEPATTWPYCLPSEEQEMPSLLEEPLDEPVEAAG